MTICLYVVRQVMQYTTPILVPWAWTDWSIKAEPFPWWFSMAKGQKASPKPPGMCLYPTSFSLIWVLLGAHRKDANGTHVHVLSSPPSFLGWHAIFRPLQK